MSQHPLSRRKPSNSPDVLTEADAPALPLAAQTASHEHRQSFRGRSKSLAYGSLAWTMTTPRFPVGYDNTNMVGGNQTSAAKSWEPILEKAIKAIISIKASHVRSFDTETSGVYSATGFIVDAEQGIILSNRHVVSPAPIVAQAVLTNYEEVDLIPIYRDPVHDFGFLKFDPHKVKFMELEQIDLCPEKAKVGLEIRVVGNDAGEKLSILAGTLARLDRRAPEYGVGEYNDFNTFYLQAASGTSGGSSGSPVLNIEGQAVALNAGGASKASSSYYLPLDRIKRALEYVRRGENVPRGTLQTEFEYLPYDEVRRLGLKAHIEEQTRKKFPEENGMLVVRSLLPKGPADNILVPGDILLGCNGNMITNFFHLFGIIDDAVGANITMTICRGKKIQDVELRVQDLHSITPNRFVEIGGGVVNELSYQLAKSYSQPVGGVYVATSGHMLASASAWRKSMILSVNNVPTPNIDAFIEAMKLLPDGARVPIRYYSLQKAYKEKVMIMHVDRHWHPFRVAIRNDQTGLWDFEEMPPAPPTQPYKPSTASFPSLDPSLKRAEKLMPSFVAIDFYLPYLVDGMKTTQFYGTGFIVSTNPPLIVCDRDTVPISVGDIFITFANSIIIPARLVFLHPFYNFVVITYDASLIGDTPVCPLQFSNRMLAQGDETYQIGIGTDHSVVMKKTTVSAITNIGTKECSPPRWRAMNVEGIKIDDSANSQGGVLTDEEGKTQALWVNYSSQNEKGKDISFMCGMPIDLVRPVIEPLIRGEKPVMRGLDIEFWTMRIAAARTLGLSDEWVKKIETSGSTRHTILYVLNILDERSACAKMLKVGDIVLSLNGNIATRMADLTVIQHLEKVHMVVFRDGAELELDVPTTYFSGYETTRVTGWQGALLQMPYKAVLEQVRNIPTGVYVSCTLYGSPASTVLRPGVWISEIQGRPVKDLDSFLETIKAHEQHLTKRRCSRYIPPVRRKESLEDEAEVPDSAVLKTDPDDMDDDDDNDEGYIRIKTVSRTNVVRVAALKVDSHYWGAWELLRDDQAVCGWVVNVQPRDIYIHYIYVPDKSTTIRWWFSTKRHNIAFGLYRTANQAQIPPSDVLFQTEDNSRVSSSPATGVRSVNAGGNGNATGTSIVNTSSRRPTLTHEDSNNSSDGLAEGSTLHTSSASIRSRRKSVASQKLADNMDEVLPIEHCNSADNKVSGQYVVEEPGSYALVFDNTFSRNTSKMLTFSVALGEREQVSGSEQTELAGWILKKRRKKMQGWAKRWFNLSSTGVLSYSIHNKSICRGSVQIFLSTISVNPQQRLIHIDSGTMIYHLKTLTPEDFEKWTKALRVHKARNMASGLPMNEGSLDGAAVSEKEFADQAKEATTVREGLAAIDGQINSIRSILDTMGNMIGDGINSPAGLNSSRARFNFRRSSSKSLSSARPPQMNASLSSSPRMNANENTAAEDVDATQMHFKLLSAMNKLKKQRDEVVDAFDKNQTYWNKIYAAYKDVSESNYANRNNGFTVENDDMVSARESFTTDKRTSSFISYRTSNHSEVFFDAEEIVISSDDDDYALAENDIIDENDEDDDDFVDSDQKSTLSGMLSENVKRRQLLPSPSVGDAASALSVFRKNVGKDLSTIAMPISMNEPLNLLQKACEELEYCQLLTRANQAETSIDRLMYVTCFAVSGYASSQYRTGRKPFNPMMCETYECIRPDKGFRFIAEKVKHNPPVVAAYAESKDFRFWQNAAVKSKFWGKSMELMSEGTVHVTLTEHDDHYTYSKPSSWVRNMIAGNKYLEHVGEMRVHNHKTGEYATVLFKEGSGGGIFGVPTKRNIISVSICNSSGKTVKKVVGKWSESLANELGKDQYEIIWRAQSPGIPDHEDYYGFTKFCVELNEISELEREKLPITDTRYRPDQRMYEEGNVDEADVEKQRIEQRQRDQRKRFEEEGGAFVPKWFELGDQEYELSEDGESTTCQIWKYNGQYWPTRESQNWPSDLLQLW